MSLLNVCGASDDRCPFNTIPHTENMASQGADDSFTITKLPTTPQKCRL